VRRRGAFWPARSAGMNVHARPRWSVSRPGDRNRATTSDRETQTALRNPNSTKGIPSVMPRDKGSTCAPGAERTSVLWRMSGCTIGSSAAWQERDGRGSAQTLGHVNPLVAVVSANRCDEMCRHAATRCWLAVCVHNTRATPPRLRACATITRTCPRSSARLGRSCSDIRLAKQTMKPVVRGACGTCLQTT